MDNFKIIVITSPTPVDHEAEKITSLLEYGVDFVHIRKPDMILREVKNLIEDIPYDLRMRLKLHGHFELFNEMNLGGAHLNKRNPMPPRNANSLSASIHSPTQIYDKEKFDYLTISPVFDSISKKEYLSKFNLDELSSKIRGHRIIALGGVMPEYFLMLKEKGFYGAAMLGYIWNRDFEKSIHNLKNKIKELKS